MNFPASRSRPSSKPLDSEFANLFGGLSHVNFETEEDRKLEAEIAKEVNRLKQEVELEHPRTPNVNPFMNTDEELVPLITTNSRRKRTIGQERPATAPTNKLPSAGHTSASGFESKPLPIIKEAAVSSGFADVRPLSVIKEKVALKKVKIEEPVSPRTMRLKLLEKEMNSAQEEREKALAEVKARAKAQLDQELQSLDQDYQSNIAQMKEWFEAKKKAIENVKVQQNKLESLTQIISKHSQTISSLSNRFSKDKEYTEDVKVQELAGKERALDSREARLATQVQLLEQEKQRLESKQRNIEEADEKFRKIIDEQREKLMEEKKAMKDLQESLKQQDREKKQILALEQHRLSLLEEQVEREEKNIEAEIENKEKEIREKENMMEIEKNEAYGQIEFEKNILHSQISQLENFKRSIPTLNADLNRRIGTCEERSKQLRVERENLQKAKEMMEKDRMLFEKEAEKIHAICTEIDKETEGLMDQKNELERRKGEIEVKRQEVLTIISKSRQDKQRVEHLKTALSQRMRVFESLKSPVKQFEIPKIDVAEAELEPIARINSRPRSAMYRSTFKASEYMKDLEEYSSARKDIQDYIAFEGERLLNSKLDYETGINKGLHASIHGFSTPSSSRRDRPYVSYLKSESISKRTDSQYISSSFYRESFN